MIRTAVVIVLFLATSPARAGEDDWFPTLHLQPRFEFGPYYATGCGCFDRWTWSAGFGGALELQRFLQLEGEYRLGGLWFPGSGYAVTSGWTIGLRAALVAENGRWTDGIYARAGLLRMEVPASREEWHSGGYGGVGYSLPVVGDRLFVESELVLNVVPGDLGHVAPVLRAGLRVPLRL